METAASILISHLELFRNISVDAEEEVVEDEFEEKSEFEKLLEMPVEELELSMRAYNCLKRANIDTVGQLIPVSYTHLDVYKRQGQRTQTNARTRKGPKKTVGVRRKK